jgi:hypothetical protein
MIKSGNQFINILNNKNKERKTCFFVLLNGKDNGNIINDLQPAQEWCFDTEQSWNRCYTARYSADGKGYVVAPLIRQFALDVTANIDFVKKAPGKAVGNIKKLDIQDWRSLEEVILGLDVSPSTPDKEMISNFSSYINSTLESGERIVLFCELENKPSLDTIGLDRKSVNSLLQILPERFGIVFSGVEDEKSLKERDKRISIIDIGPDYLAIGPPEDRSQKLYSDTDEGKDALNVLGEVNALADAIAAKDMEPPLVLGVLGGWGSGKSYVMNLLKRRLLELRNKNILDPKVRLSFPYVGHFYMVCFNAWTYAKADLWASLMQEVLLALNDQIAYEQLKVERLSPDSDDLKYLESFEKTLGNQKEFKKETAKNYINLPKSVKWPKSLRATSHKVLTNRYLEYKRQLFNKMFTTLLAGKDEFTLDVVEKLTGEDTDVRATLEKLDNNILWSRLQGLNKRLQNELNDEENRLKTAKLKLALSEANIKARIDLMLRRRHWRTFTKTLTGTFATRFMNIIKKSQTKNGDTQTIPLDQTIKSFGLHKMIFAGRSPRTIIYFIIFAAVFGLLTYLAIPLYKHWIAISGLLGGSLASVFDSWHRVNKWFEEQVEEFNNFNKRLDEENKERREALILKAQSEKSHQERVEKVAEYESNVQAFREKVGLTAGHPTLMDFITDRLEEGGYEERLGPLHQIQNDMQQLTDGLKSKELCVKNNEIGRWIDLNNLLFPRGVPRVVLFIDDLDRCPPDRVVEVLEAAQLLVKTNLFVVVIGMDVRYVTKALEKAYAGVLDRRGAPSGLDYIEKIVQIPYRIRPISEDAMPAYLRSQMQIKIEEMETKEGEEKLSDDKNLSVISEPGEGTRRIDETIPQSVLAFDEHELDLINNTALAVSIGPRSTKRLVNVMKLIKIIWHRTGQKDISLDIKKTVIFFLTLSARYAEIMRRVLLQFERIVCNPEQKDFKKNLPEVISHIVDKWSKNEGRPGEWQFLSSSCSKTDLLPTDMTLEKLGKRNLELVRSFSFVGEVHIPPDPTSHKVSLQYLNSDSVNINLKPDNSEPS